VFEDGVLNHHCGLAIVGAGPGGVYTAWRLLKEQPRRRVCLFEMRNRVGGRIWSVRGLGPDGDLVVDSGAYRYRPGDQVLVTTLIENGLKLDYRLYEPRSDVYKVITDENGIRTGYVTFVEKMLEEAVELGLEVYFETEVTSIIETQNTDEQGFILVTAGGETFIAKQIVLNLPQKPLLRLFQASSVAFTQDFPQPLHSVFPVLATKWYVYYPRAWWLEMGLDAGEFSEHKERPGRDTPIHGRYHDGHTICRDPEDNSTCHGFLLATYIWDQGYRNYSDGQGYDSPQEYGMSIRFMQEFMVPKDRNSPVIMLDDSTYQGRRILRQTHKKILEIHEENPNITVPDYVKDMVPEMGVLSVWDFAVPGLGTAWSNFKTGSQRNGERIPSRAIQPFAGKEIYVANEAFSSVTGWAEGSLIMAENILRFKFGLDMPDFIPNRYSSNYTDILFDVFLDEAPPTENGGEERIPQDASGSLGG